MAIPARQIKVSRFLDRAIPAYARSLNRLTGDFSAAAAFLLSGPPFERIGCTGRSFVATAKAAYGGKGPAAPPAETRRLGVELLAEAARILDQLTAAAAEYQRELDERRRTGELLTKAAETVFQEAEGALAAGLRRVLEEAPETLPDDPEDLAARLGTVAVDTFKVLHGAWTAIYDELQNASLPPPPFALSGRQMYIETVKLFNQYRLGAGAADRSRQSRGFFALGRRGDSHQGLTGNVPEALVKIVEGVADVIRAALNQWQRSALERAYRQGPEPASAALDQATLQEELSQITRTIEQLSSLRAELARGLSARHYLINLLRRASSCSQSR